MRTVLHSISRRAHLTLVIAMILMAQVARLPVVRVWAQADTPNSVDVNADVPTSRVRDGEPSTITPVDGGRSEQIGDEESSSTNIYTDIIELAFYFLLGLLLGLIIGYTTGRARGYNRGAHDSEEANRANNG